VIPYTVDRRADTGVTNVTMGIWLFLASEVMLFGALFSAYTLLRVSALHWPHGRDLLDVKSALTNTAVLLASSYMVWRARVGDGRSTVRRLSESSVLAIVFLGLKAQEYRGDLSQGLVPAASTFLALYFTLTGLHALHVLGGLIANVWAASGLRRVGPAMTAGRVHALSLYWTFVDLVWLVILWLIYLS
jgi:heme/copper-type cytochrome/quinol oxidase subunit 3